MVRERNSKRFADANAASKAYAYHVTRIEVLAGTIDNDLSGTAPNVNTSTTNQGKANLHLMPNHSTMWGCRCQRAPLVSRESVQCRESNWKGKLSRWRIEVRRKKDR